MYFEHEGSGDSEDPVLPKGLDWCKSGSPKWIHTVALMTIFKHFGNGKNLTLELISVHQTIMGDPNNGQNEFESNRSYLNIVDNCFLVPVMGTKREMTKNFLLMY